jgi:hypothetical protein
MNIFWAIEKQNLCKLMGKLFKKHRIYWDSKRYNIVHKCYTSHIVNTQIPSWNIIQSQNINNETVSTYFEIMLVRLFEINNGERL